MRSKLGVSAKAGALALMSSDRPQPSRMHKTTGFQVLIDLLLPVWGRSSVLRGRGEALKRVPVREKVSKDADFGPFRAAWRVQPVRVPCGVALPRNGRLT